MDETISIFKSISYIFAFLYGVAAIGIFIYGIISIINKQTRVFKDDDSSYGFSKKLTIVDSLIRSSVKPFIYHRIFPRDSEGLTGDSAILVGWIYVIIGLLLMSPLIWAYIKLG